MGSEQNNETSYQPSQPTLCANNCGFFGNPSTMNLCSKCHREIQNREEQAASAKSAMEKSLNPRPQIDAVPAAPSEESSSSPSSVAVAVAAEAEPKMANRCRSCNKKLGLTGFKCKCGVTFCGAHRYPENHECTFDFKASGRSAIARANPVVKADKLDKC